MEYKYIEKSWHDCFEKGDIDEALRLIEYQIALNLLLVHNNFCEKQMSAPMEVYSSLSYGKMADGAVNDEMEKFVEIDEKFIGIRCALNDGYSKEEAIHDYEELEIELQERIVRLKD